MTSRYLEFGGKLALVCMIAMLGVAGAYVAAKPRIEEGKKAAFDNAIREVLGLPPGGEAPAAVDPDLPRDERIFKAEVEGEVRYAAQGTHQGFASKIVVAVGARLVEDELRIVEVRVISQNETPGLGTRIEEEESDFTLWKRIGNIGQGALEQKDWFFLKHFRGRSIDELRVTKDPAEEEKILVISGVTITTNATVAAVKKALLKIREEVL